MLGVLIVEDEMIVRYGIKSMVNWESLGLTVIGDAGNGKEALELFKKYNPEIVITDIKMPEMDGIELLKNIRGINSSVRVIILSSYQEFEAARDALRFGAVEYLLKSDMMPSDLEEVLTRVKDAFIEETKGYKREDSRPVPADNEQVRIEDFLWDISTGALVKNEKSVELAHQLGLGYLRDSIFTLIISVDYYEKIISGFMGHEKKSFTKNLILAVREAVGEIKDFSGEVFSGDRGEIVLLLKVIDSDGVLQYGQRVKDIGERIIQKLCSNSGLSITVGISNPVDDLFSIKDGYIQANKAYKYKMFYGCGKVIEYSHIEKNKNTQKLLFNTKELQENVYLLRYEFVEEFLKRTFGVLREQKDYEGVNFVSIELIMSLCNTFLEVCNDNEKAYKMKKEYYDQIKYFETIEDIYEWLKCEFRLIMDYINSVHSKDKNVIKKALAYIDNNYNKQINLLSVSEHIHLSKNYFVNLFKREVGESFIEYLTKIRVEKAKELLRSTELKTSEIGEMVGIEDSRYFSKVFKKITGATPTEYKEMRE